MMQEDSDSAETPAERRACAAWADQGRRLSGCSAASRPHPAYPHSRVLFHLSGSFRAQYNATLVAENCPSRARGAWTGENSTRAFTATRENTSTLSKMGISR